MDKLLKIRYLYSTIIFLLAIVTLSSCSKKEYATPVTSNGTTFEFSNLVADNSTIKLGEKTNVTASAKGENLTFTWSTKKGGTIIGSGSQVTFYASCPACLGSDEVYCTVSDDNSNKMERKLIIAVTN